MEKTKIKGILSEDEIKKIISDRLTFLWDKYITLIHLITTLSTGTLYIFYHSIELGGVYERVYMGVIGAVCAIFSLGTALIWRFVSQYFMEREVFGNKEDVIAYYKMSIVNPATTSFEKDKHDKLFHKIYKIFPYLACFSLAFAWIFFIIFSFSNI